jgi:hypothetical protein
MSAFIQGRGDVFGPVGGVADGDYAVYSGTSGKVIKRPSAYRPGGRLYVNTAAVGNTAGAGLKDLHTYTLPAGTLARVNDCLRVDVSMQFGANANSKQFVIFFGAMTPVNFTGTFNNQFFRVTAKVFKSGTNTQTSYDERINPTSTTVNSAPVSGTEIDTAPIIIKVQGSGTNVNEIIAYLTTIDFIPAP